MILHSLSIILYSIAHYIRSNINAEKYNLVLWIPVLQCIGILIYFSLSNEPSLIVTALISFLVLILFFIFYKKYTILSIAIFAILMGFTTSKIKTAIVDTKMLSEEKYIKNIIATVKDINHKGSYQQFLLALPKFTLYKEDIRLDNIKIAVRTTVDENITIGDQVRLSVKLFPVRAAPAIYAYDFARIAYYKQISATGFATSRVHLYKKARKREYIKHLRQYIYNNLQHHTNRPYTDIISALLIGKKDGIDQKTMDAIRNSGVAHLFAISGLHLSFVASLFFLVFRNLFALSETLTLKYDTKKIASFLTLLPTTFYLLITGTQISAQRAYIMAVLVLIAIILERKYRGLVAISFAASAMLVLEPESILQPSFQMSFSAVLALISSYQIHGNKLFNVKIVRYFLSIIISSIVASLATLPYVIYNFNYFSIGGIVTNLIAIPMVTFIIIPLGMIYISLIPLGIERFIVPLMTSTIDGLLYVIDVIADLKYLIINVHAFSAASIILMTFGLLWLCLWTQKWRFLGVFIIIFGLYLGITYSTPDILVSSDNIVIKENDNLLYSLTKKNRNFVINTWARKNGQDRIMSHTKYKNTNKRLVCSNNICTYSKENNSVLLAYTIEDILKNCTDVSLIIQLNKFNCATYHSNIIKYSDLENYGTHSIWVTQNGIKIKKIWSNRPWLTLNQNWSIIKGESVI